MKKSLTPKEVSIAVYKIITLTIEKFDNVRPATFNEKKITREVKAKYKDWVIPEVKNEETENKNVFSKIKKFKNKTVGKEVKKLTKVEKQNLKEEEERVMKKRIENNEKKRVRMIAKEIREARDGFRKKELERINIDRKEFVLNLCIKHGVSFNHIMNVGGFDKINDIDDIDDSDDLND